MRQWGALVVCALWCLCGMAQEVDYLIEAKRGVVADGYDFWVTRPKSYEACEDSVPLVVFLHGASLCGGNMERVKRYGTIDAVERGLELEAVCVAPHNRGGAWNPSRVMEVVEYMEEHYRIDTRRIYVLGMSLGGYGVLDFVGTYPEKIAAALALCGGCTLRSYEGLSKLPLYIVHGDADRAVKVEKSREIVREIRERYDSTLLKYTELDGVNHSKPAHAFYHLDTYDWLFRHDRDVRVLDTTFTITREMLYSPYQLTRSGEVKPGYKRGRSYVKKSKKSGRRSKKTGRRRRRR